METRESTLSAVRRLRKGTTVDHYKNLSFLFFSFSKPVKRIIGECTSVSSSFQLTFSFVIFYTPYRWFTPEHRRVLVMFQDTYTGVVVDRGMGCAVPPSRLGPRTSGSGNGKDVVGLKVSWRRCLTNTYPLSHLHGFEILML